MDCDSVLVVISSSSQLVLKKIRYNQKSHRASCVISITRTLICMHLFRFICVCVCLDCCIQFILWFIVKKVWKSLIWNTHGSLNVFFGKLWNLQKSCKNNRMNTSAFHLASICLHCICFCSSLCWYHFSQIELVVNIMPLYLYIPQCVFPKNKDLLIHSGTITVLNFITGRILFKIDSI